MNYISVCAHNKDKLTLWRPSSKVLIVDSVTGPLYLLLSLPFPQLDGQASSLLQHVRDLLWHTGHQMCIRWVWHHTKCGSKTKKGHLWSLLYGVMSCVNVPIYMPFSMYPRHIQKWVVFKMSQKSINTWAFQPNVSKKHVIPNPGR